jgi:hypothetical protein
MRDSANRMLDLGIEAGKQPPPRLSFQADVLHTTSRVRRAAAGPARHVNLMVVDQCGAWPTFAGAGPNDF